MIFIRRKNKFYLFKIKKNYKNPKKKSKLKFKKAQNR